MNLIIIKGFLPVGFPYVIAGEMLDETEEYIKKSIFPAVGLDVFKPDYTLELSFFVKENEEAYTVIKSRINNKKKEIACGIRLSLGKLTCEQTIALHNFWDLFEAGFKEIIKSLKFDPEKADLTPLKNKFFSEPKRYFPLEPPESDRNRLIKFLNSRS